MLAGRIGGGAGQEGREDSSSTRKRFQSVPSGEIEKVIPRARKYDQITVRSGEKRKSGSAGTRNLSLVKSRRLRGIKEGKYSETAENGFS